MDNNKKTADLVTQLAKLHPEINKELLLNKLIKIDDNIIKKEKKKIKLKIKIINEEVYFLCPDNFLWNRKAERIGFLRNKKPILYFENNIDLNKIDFRADGFPEELVDNELEEKGYEI